MTLKFPEECQRMLKSYVYVYYDPDTHEPFYVGMGQGNRAFDHLEEQGDSEKVKKIQSLLLKNKEPEIVILKYGMDEETAHAVETAVIDYIGLSKLTNAQLGHDSNRIDAKELIAMYGGDELEPEDVPYKVVCLHVNQFYDPDMTKLEKYNAIRGFWKVDIERASKAKYVFAVCYGKVVEVFKDVKWMQAGSTFLAPRPYDSGGPVDKRKKEFIGQFAGKIVQNKFVGKSVAKITTVGGQNPVSYIPQDKNEWK